MLAFLLSALLGGSGTVALQAGTVHLVEDGRVLSGGATILVRDGKILAVGKDISIPPGAEIVDYGFDAVIVPGLVSANSNVGISFASPRTAAPGVRAVDGFDANSTAYAYDLTGGVTCAYIAPARGRLIAGQGAVIKLAGDDELARIVSESAALHGAIDDQARGTPGYWEIPVPATAETGLGVEQPQLPRSLMGAMVALQEILDVTRGTRDDDRYGPNLSRDLKPLLQRQIPWRMGANSLAEVRALLSFAKQHRLAVVIDGAAFAGPAAVEIAAAQVAVIVEVPINPGRAGRDLGQGEDDPWPALDTASRLASAGVKIAIATPSAARSRELRYCATQALTGGLSPEAALRAITLGAAEILGVAARVGSITVGKDADFAVLNGAPLSASTSVLATWIDGEMAWKTPTNDATVIEVDELHVGDGEVLRPGQVLLQEGKIVEVGHRVGKPLGATIVRGKAAMPGIVDAFGFLGLEGSSKVPAPDFKLSRIVEPGDRLDRRVAKAGVTTVVLAPRGSSNQGTPILAYRPAAQAFERLIVEEACALRLVWTNPTNRLESGKSAQQLLDKALEYDKKWKAYEEALAKWTPPKEAAPVEPKSEDKADAEKKDEEASDEKKDESADKEKKDDKDKKKEEAPPVDPINGVWSAAVVVSPIKDEQRFRLRLEHKDEAATAWLRCEPLSDELILLVGTYEEVEKGSETPKDGDKSEKKEEEKSDEKKPDEKKPDEKKEEKKPDKKSKDKKEKDKLRRVHLAGLLRGQGITLEAELDKDGKLVGHVSQADTKIEFKAHRLTIELEVAGRTERRREKVAEEQDADGKPKTPGIDEKLEPLRRAMHGTGAIVVDVDREDEILECVAAFEKAGIRPVLFGAGEVWRVAAQIRGRVAGVLLPPAVLGSEFERGLDSLQNRYAELARNGIPVAFHSEAEEGAADLWLNATYAIANGLSPEVALRALTSEAAAMLGIGERVGTLRAGLDGDVLVLDGSPLEPGTRVLRTFVGGAEVR